MSTLREFQYEEIGTRRQRLLGVVGLAVTLAAVLVVAVLYFVPFGSQSYRAELTEAGSVSVGDDVRVAGVSVGRVRSLDLGDESVTMTFDVDDHVHVGDKTSIELRMLTPVGGHYVALFPAGDQALTAPIPASRVRLPYSLIEVFNDAHRPLAETDGAVVNRNLKRLSDAVGKNPGALREFTDGLSTMVGMIDRQRRDVARTFDVAQEYVQVLTDSRGMIGEMLGKIGLMEEQILARKGEVVEALDVATELFSRIAALEPSWRFVEPMLDQLLAVRPQLSTLNGKLGELAGTLHAAGDRLGRLVGPDGIRVDQSSTMVELSDVCVPVPGRQC